MEVKGYWEGARVSKLGGTGTGILYLFFVGTVEALSLVVGLWEWLATGDQIGRVKKPIIPVSLLVCFVAPSSSFHRY